MPGANDLMLRIYAAKAQRERELIGARTRAALAAARARGVALGGDRGHRPPQPPDARAAALARAEAAERTAHRLRLEVERLRDEGIASLQGLARGLSERKVPTPRGSATWTHTTVARLLTRTAQLTCLIHDGVGMRQADVA
jgi:DNA invertase Pin-like site-specific DNA recombinase